MRDMRNIVSHEYFGVDLTIVWNTIRNHLPQLIARMQSIVDAPEQHPAG